MSRRTILALATLVVAPSLAAAQASQATTRARTAVREANSAAAARGAIPATPARSISPASAPGSTAPLDPALAAAGGVEKGHATGIVDSSGTALSFRREVYAFERGDRRDPFVSLMTTGVLRPVVSDLLLVGVAYADAGRSVAVFRDKQTKEQYRVKTGEMLGRMRVYAIEPRKVTFAIDEFGFNRHESIQMGDTTRLSLTQTTRMGTP
ncbi:MAG: hypothetical protein MUF21_00800 [Gemmatimonadaceae bacterium]|jgi:hypothetical protein|nr:hypothetical protein [Gemmatimonadaceae bacterium]